MFTGIPYDTSGGGEGWRLATAEIIYRLPDHPSLLQSYIWQNYDLPPDYPALNHFLEFWEENLDGPLHSVRLAHSARLAPARWRHRKFELRLH